MFVRRLRHNRPASRTSAALAILIIRLAVEVFNYNSPRYYGGLPRWEANFPAGHVGFVFCFLSRAEGVRAFAAAIVAFVDGRRPALTLPPATIRIGGLPLL